MRHECALGDDTDADRMGGTPLTRTSKIFDHHLRHGTVRNDLDHPRAVFYLQMFPVGTPEEAAENIAVHEAGIAPSWWRWKAWP